MKMAAHLAKMLSMRGMIGAHNQNIVEVDKMKGKPAKMRSIMCWNVEPVLRKPKRHADELEGRDDGGLGDVVGEHLHLVVPLE